MLTSVPFTVSVPEVMSVHPVDGAQQGGLARAGTADDGDELAVLNGQVYIVQAHGAVGIYLGYMVKFNHTVSSSS